ncbi:inositol monophosphatase family protein [Bacillus sp. PS06]|uniref:inositol monophosphatase family protein n=1 Tax=Bacillus sp. PS06 TaxID=2764176 RepID=UPI00177F989F|nr:inositol monophosphatase family protein [Bacillus sp. PS06]MBD8068445.1 inositol monophosphatase family protein [Bacillus sp. PS06]
MTNWHEIDTNAKQWITEAGEKIRQSFKAELTIQTKSNADDLVTNMDKETEQFFINKINEVYPTHKILGEEGFGDKLTDLDGIVWIIDPIDGTMNFIYQQRNFAISIAVFEQGVGKLGFIYDVVHDELYHAIQGEGAYFNGMKIPELQDTKISEAIVGINATWITENKRINPQVLAPLIKDVRGTRSYGSAALEIAYVVTGRLDAYITMRLSPWDFAAGLVLIEEVGGKMTTLEGDKVNLLGENSILVAKKSIHEEIVTTYIVK